MTTPLPLNILCFGDSLTAGYSSWGMVFTPYSTVLKSSLSQHFGDSMSITITTDGVSGELVLMGFKARMKAHCKPASSSRIPTKSPASASRTSKLRTRLFGVKDDEGKSEGKVSNFAAKLFANGISLPQKSKKLADEAAEKQAETKDTDEEGNSTKNPYDWVIFLGGTNDLGWGKASQEIFSEIKAVTQIPLDAGARVLIMTVPECHSKSANLDKKRDELNALIKADERAGVHVLDLRTLMPYHSLTPTACDELWDDGLHFKPAGYARIGEFVAAALVAIMDPPAAAVKTETETETESGIAKEDPIAA